jgi:uncharacterized OsmC-like protein
MTAHDEMPHTNVSSTGTSREVMDDRPAVGLDPAGAESVTVHGSAAGFAQEIAVGRHRLTGDEAVSVGGTDTGPNPYGFLLAALGSCTSMTVAMYARRKGWPLEAVTVRLRHSKIYAADSEQCATTERLLDQIDRDVELTGALSEEQRARLLAIANRCPVHRTLTSKVDIQTRLTSRDEDLLARSKLEPASHPEDPTFLERTSGGE